MLITRFPLTLLALLLTAPALAEQFTGKVVGVFDGDTISVMHDGKAEKIRLNRVDAPSRNRRSAPRRNT